MRNTNASNYIALISFFILLCNCSFIRKTELEEYYIPKGYIGKVYILYGQKEGLEKEYIFGKRIYRINKNGVLFTKFEPNDGVFNGEDMLFFYVDSLGNKLEIKKISMYDTTIPVNSVIIFGMVHGGKEGIENIKEFFVDSSKNINKYTPFDFSIDELLKKK